MWKPPKWTPLREGVMVEHLGLLPSFLDENNPDDAKTQLHNNYTHGGGWHPFKGFVAVPNIEYGIKYPGDPAYKPLAKAELREETIVLYPHAWVAVWQKDGTFEISRMD